MGAIDTLLLSENLRKYRITLKCSTCDYSEHITIHEDTLKDYLPPDCPKCENPTQMEITEKIDLIDELSELCENTSCTVVLISENSEEGSSLTAAFDGIAGIARYPIDNI
jgi:peptide chain release factor subunit 1